MEINGWTFAKAAYSPVGPPRDQKEALKDAERWAKTLMNAAVNSLKPLRFRIGRIESEFDHHSPGKEYAGDILVTMTAEADPKPLLDWEEFEVDRALFDKLYEQYQQALHRYGMKPSTYSDEDPGSVSKISVEVEAEDRSRSMTSYVHWEGHNNNKISILVTILVAVRENH